MVLLMLDINSYHKNMTKPTQIFRNLKPYVLAIVSCALITSLGIVFLVKANPGPTTIGQDISTTGFTATGAISLPNNSITDAMVFSAANWNTAYGWGDWSGQGFITVSSADALTNKTGNISMWTNDSSYLTSYTETDPVFSVSSASGIAAGDITNWNTAHTDVSAIPATVLSSATQPINSKGNSFSTIQAAINDQASNGWVYVPPGTYTEAVDIIGKNNLMLFGAGWGMTKITNATKRPHIRHRQQRRRDYQGY